MGYIVCAFAFFWVGLKYGELRDIMLARRISRLVAQQQGVQKDQEDYERWQRQDKRIGKRQRERERELEEEEADD